MGKRSGRKIAVLFATVLLSLMAQMPEAYAMSVSGKTASIESTLGFTQPVGGNWICEDGFWYYRTAGGLLKSRWACIECSGVREWFLFDENGRMRTGWIKSVSDNWYYLRETKDGRLGAMEKGWLYEPVGGFYYYMDLDSGAMKKGWCRIEGKYYYLSEANTSAFVWNKEKGQYVASRVEGIPMGALYTNTVTPDGYTVDGQGVWNGR